MDPLDLLTRWGLGLVFGATLAEQAGLPFPAAPVLIAAGALADEGVMRPEAVLFVAVCACLLADHAWFFAGRFRGRAILAGICRISLSPDTCVRKTDDLITRHGAALLMVAKFVPGISAVAIPTAAAMGLPYRRFLFYDAIGCLGWCAAYAGAGMIFGRGVRRLLDALSNFGAWSLVAVAAAFAVYIAWKVRRRVTLGRLFGMVRIEPHEVAALLAADHPDILILDTRSRLVRTQDPRFIPRSMVFEADGRIDSLPPDARDHTIITFCTCPNDASAALLADRLLKSGYTNVRVLTGGSEALELLGASA